MGRAEQGFTPLTHKKVRILFHINLTEHAEHVILNTDSDSTVKFYGRKKLLLSFWNLVKTRFTV